MNEKEADVIRKSMYESLLMDENDKICLLYTSDAADE